MWTLRWTLVLLVVVSTASCHKKGGGYLQPTPVTQR
jgi:predicted small lipoprotein YifL